MKTKFDANAIITANCGDVAKTQLAAKYAAYNSRTGKPTRRLLALALGHDMATLTRLCKERNII